MFEEEDFQPMVYGYRLVPDVSEARTMGMLKEVEEELHRRTRSKPSDLCSSDEVSSCFFYYLYFFVLLSMVEITPGTFLI